ncbi:hypothetical protein [Sphingomonas immobilis]|uniref:Uncharacterized protein n=1 Tax=Sphingomonas immobilis TaxID=3063997 RepID=A0ABT8ZVC9_9SPHN|nr:hypothetical protein [Sphingomonas sp. CA1-15]MDO7841540.1 hypothetical protein [Sphingomonas sp. CA1-15]
MRAAVAVDILEQSNRAAAAWWREYAPNVLRPNGAFLFDLACGEVLSGPT